MICKCGTHVTAIPFQDCDSALQQRLPVYTRGAQDACYWVEDCAVCRHPAHWQYVPQGSIYQRRINELRASYGG